LSQDGRTSSDRSEETVCNKACVYVPKNDNPGRGMEFYMWFPITHETNPGFTYKMPQTVEKKFKEKREE